jgi:hypothetical protein
MNHDRFKKRQIGKITDRVIKLLNLNIEIDTPIYINGNNLSNIKRKHPQDFKKYGHKIKTIIENLTYISQHPRNGSIEYIKVYKEVEEYVLVAIRISHRGNYYVRTLFVMAEEKIIKYWLKGVFLTY